MLAGPAEGATVRHGHTRKTRARLCMGNTKMHRDTSPFHAHSKRPQPPRLHGTCTTALAWHVHERTGMAHAQPAWQTHRPYEHPRSSALDRPLQLANARWNVRWNVRWGPMETLAVCEHQGVSSTAPGRRSCACSRTASGGGTTGCPSQRTADSTAGSQPGTRTHDTAGTGAARAVR